MSCEKKNIESILRKSQAGQKITMLTAYDFPFAKILDEAGIDIILVGDSLANVVLGLESTQDVGMDEMLHHAKAVRRAVKQALLVADMPYAAYQVQKAKVLVNARRFVEEAGCEAVKVEWFADCVKVVEKLTKGGVAVMGHVGLTPQTAEQLGGLRVQGKDAASAKRIIENALSLEQAGCFSVVLECIPGEVARIITERLSIPTIGIGAGIHCRGQVLVTYDLLGLFDGFTPKFVKRFADLRKSTAAAVKQFQAEVTAEQFPSREQSFTIHQDELKKLVVSDR